MDTALSRIRTTCSTCEANLYCPDRPARLILVGTYSVDSIRLICTVTGAVRAEHAYWGTSCGAPTLEVGKSPTATTRRAELPV